MPKLNKSTCPLTSSLGMAAKGGEKGDWSGSSVTEASTDTWQLEALISNNRNKQQNQQQFPQATFYAQSRARRVRVGGRIGNGGHRIMKTNV